MMSSAEDPTVQVRLGAITESGYLLERAEVRAGLILYRARPSSRASEGARSYEAQGATDVEAVGNLYAAWAAGGSHS